MTRTLLFLPVEHIQAFVTVDGFVIRGERTSAYQQSFTRDKDSLL